MLLLIVTISDPPISHSLELLDKQLCTQCFQITEGSLTQGVNSALFWGSFCPTRLCLKFPEVIRLISLNWAYCIPLLPLEGW